MTAGEPLLTLHSDDADRFTRAEEALAGAVDIDEGAEPDDTLRDVILDRLV